PRRTRRCRRPRRSQAAWRASPRRRAQRESGEACSPAGGGALTDSWDVSVYGARIAPSRAPDRVETRGDPRIRTAVKPLSFATRGRLSAARQEPLDAVGDAERGALAERGRHQQGGIGGVPHVRGLDEDLRDVREVRAAVLVRAVYAGAAEVARVGHAGR